MKRIAAIVLWAFVCAPASAGEVFKFSFATLATVVTEEAPGVVKDTYTFPWSGQLTVEMLSTADGVHVLNETEKSDIVFIGSSANTPQGGPGGEGAISFDYWGYPSSGPKGPASVTFLDGQIIDIETGYSVSGGHYSYGVEVDGMTVTYSNISGLVPDLYSYYATATASLVPITPIPEPSTCVLMGLGLFTAAARAGRRQPSAAMSLR